MSVLCWVFVRASFPRNTGKNWIFIVDRRLYTPKLQELDITDFIKLIVYAFLGKNSMVFGSPQVFDEKIL